jgi:hypothetical protein
LFAAVGGLRWNPTSGSALYGRAAWLFAGFGGQTMSEYSIYTITHDEQSFSDSCAIIHCADDEEAIQTAEQWVDLHDVELWESNRFITRFSPTNLHMSS